MARARQWRVVLGLAGAVLVALVYAEGVAEQRQETQRLARCEEAVVRARHVYASEATRRLMQCVRPLGECQRAGVGLDPAACAGADAPCAELPDDIEALEARVQTRVAGACRPVPVERLADTTQVEATLRCPVDSHDAFEECLLRSLRGAVGAQASRLRPGFCGLVAAADLIDVLPPETCASLAADAAARRAT